MSDVTQVGELLPCCPFCGSKPYTRSGEGWFEVHCSDEDDDCDFVPWVSKATEEKAIAAWNRRATPSPVGASVLSEVVAQTIYEALCETQIKLARLKPNIDTQSRLSRINAALAWLAQQRGQG